MLFFLNFKMFSTFFWAVSRGPGAHAHHFRIPLPLLHTLSKNFQKFFFKTFLGPFPVPQGLTPTIFEFPFSSYITSNFSRRFYLISFTILLSHFRRFEIFSSHISYTLFQNKNFLRTFLKKILCPLPGPPGLTPTIFELPFLCYIPSQKNF